MHGPEVGTDCIDGCDPSAYRSSQACCDATTKVPDLMENSVPANAGDPGCCYHGENWGHSRRAGDIRNPARHKTQLGCGRHRCASADSRMKPIHHFQAKPMVFLFGSSHVGPSNRIDHQIGVRRLGHGFSFRIGPVANERIITTGLLQKLYHLRRLLLTQERQLQDQQLSALGKLILSPLGR